MTEEQVTKAILKWLLDNNWEIVCFDFPQSGTGRLLHPNGSTEKNKDAINPDIVAVKNGVCLFFENKDRYYLPDFEKQSALINENNYSDAIRELLANYEVDRILYGIGLPDNKYCGGAVDNRDLVDFIVGVNNERNAFFLFDKHRISIE